MKNFGILILLLGVFASVGCSGSKQVPDQNRDSAADIYEIGEVYPLEEEPKKARKSWRKKKQEQEVAALGEEVLKEEAVSKKSGAKPKKPSSSLDSALETLNAAKVHLELGDYDFAGDELRKIGSGSELYKEAQRLLEAYR
ncbi:MAG: hypothetical protein ACI9UA_002434 [Pseudoalteromonas tetraodonis]|jgi:hypothetical protein